MSPSTSRRTRNSVPTYTIILAIIIGCVVAVIYWPSSDAALKPPPKPELKYEPRYKFDSSGFGILNQSVNKWHNGASLDEIRTAWFGLAGRLIETVDRDMATRPMSVPETMNALLWKAAVLNSDSQPGKAYQVLEQARSEVEGKDSLAVSHLYTIIFLQGVAALRRGETENCVMCRGESSCILPINPAAIHTKPEGSRLAIHHFTEYLKKFPNDLEAKWLLNVAHMTLGEHPDKVDPAYLISIDQWAKSEFDIGKFRDVGHLVGVNRFNQAGGVIMDDFDGDGLLDIMCTTWDATTGLEFYRNKGDGTFEVRTAEAGLSNQYGGLNLVQADYNNDGHLDFFVPRGAWISTPVRPSLYRNNGNGTFTDVTEAAGLLDPVNSNCAAWVDYDNDGHLDLFICCERQSNRLYHNKGDGTFEEVSEKAGLKPTNLFCKGCTWLDYDNDGYPDLFLNNLGGKAQLYHNNGNGTFTDVTKEMGITGPNGGFACWAFDYDNDGWLDIFATCYDRSVEGVVQGMTGKPHKLGSNRLFRNLKGKGFADVTEEAGLDMVFATMGCNFADFDNDGYLDFYLGTGEPNLSSLMPNRMFKNVGGKRFAEITGSSGTGHLQKGHGVACGDWDRDGNIDIFIQMGGAVNGDRYHNILFQNPGQTNHSVTVKLVGTKTNRSAIGARIKVVTAGANPQTIYRHVTWGSSFGANPLEQTIGLGQAQRAARIEITWPTSKSTQVFEDVAGDQIVEITEFAKELKVIPRKQIPLPK